jgi:hypothetical protein
MPTTSSKPGVVVTQINSVKASMVGWPYNLGQLREIVKAFDGLSDEVELVIVRPGNGAMGAIDFIAPPHPAVH